MSVYVLYHQKTRSTFDVNKFIPRFEVLYEKYNIEMLGYWSVVDDETETYMLYRYESEEDMMTKAGLLMEDRDYVALREEITSFRLSIEETLLSPMWVPE